MTRLLVVGATSALLGLWLHDSAPGLYLLVVVASLVVTIILVGMAVSDD
jgi:hypothetical protein